MENQYISKTLNILRVGNPRGLVGGHAERISDYRYLEPGLPKRLQARQRVERHESRTSIKGIREPQGGLLLLAAHDVLSYAQRGGHVLEGGLMRVLHMVGAMENHDGRTPAYSNAF